MAKAYNRIRAAGQPSSAGGPFFGFASALDARAAFTLVEVLIGVAILGLTTVALYGAFSFGFTTIRLSQEEVRADQILVQKLETLRIYDWSALTNNFLPTTFTDSYSTTGTQHGATYNGSLTVTPYVQSAASESYYETLRQVTASVSWLSGGVPRTRSMTTLVSQYGIQTYKKP